MFKKILISSLSILLLSSFVYLNQTSGPDPKSRRSPFVCDAQDRGPSNYVPTNKTFVDGPLVLEGPKDVNGTSIGPEIAVTGMTGFYDYQMNGNQEMHIYRHNSTVMYASYMTSPDSLNIATSRVSKTAVSSDEGLTWTDNGAFPSFKSGYPTMCGKSDGTGMMGNHYSVNIGTFGARSYMNYDLGPGIGNFNGVPTTLPVNYAWPVQYRLTNGNMFQIGTSYETTATDTICVGIFNSNTNAYISFSKLVTPALPNSGQLNMSLGNATGPNGTAYVLCNPYREVLGNWGTSRIFLSESTDNGITWGSFITLFNPHVISGDSIVPNFNGSCDIIADGSGNYYWAFNSLGPSRFYVNGRLLVGKNNNNPAIIAGTSTSPINPIPQVADFGTTHSQAFIANFDHVCLALSDDNQYIFASYSVPFQNDTLNNFNKCHIFYQYAKTSDMVWSTPILVTDSGANSWDERYCSLNRVAPSQGGGYTLYMVYQKKRQPGSYAYLDNAPECKASLTFRTITNASVIGIKNNHEVVNEFRLNQNYPNPFNPSTVITFNVRNTSQITLKVYNIAGQLVTTLLNNSVFESGVQNIEFNASSLASGVYFYTLTSNEIGSNKELFRDSKKMILVK
jgi:hypothetical protein